MSDKIKIPELLVPAGGMEQLKAAAANGADAVYMSGTSFNARLNARNFSDGELLEAVDFAHKNGVKVHITQNTLIRTDEMKEAVENAARMYEIGADALIVQDRGLAAVLKKAVPEIPLHLSTQGTVYDAAGVREAAAAGFDRVILSRELSGKEIKNICAASETEIEVFVHGAICICYSGQCRMSGFIGGRSGNRGVCAQPCRLPYELLRNGVSAGAPPYPLSPSDMNLLSHLRELAEAGVASLKIEGRMKSPEYVAVVTSVYRKYLDILAEQAAGSSGGAGEDIEKRDMLRLSQVFSRGGFTDAYFMGESGKQLMSDELPKHQGVKIGETVSVDRRRGHVVIKLNRPLSNGDGVEIRKIHRNGVKNDNAGGLRENTGDNGPIKAAGGIITYIKQIGEPSAEKRGRRSGNRKNKDNGGENAGRSGALMKRAEGGMIVEAGDIPALSDYPENTFEKGTPVYKISDAALNSEARASYEKMPQRIGVSFLFEGKAGSRGRLTAEISAGILRESAAGVSRCGKPLSITVLSGNIFEKAIKKPSDEESVSRQLKKTGGTSFYTEECRVILSGEPSIPASEINAMRREALEGLTELLTEKPARIDRRSTGSVLDSFYNKTAAAGDNSDDLKGRQEIILNMQYDGSSAEYTAKKAISLINDIKLRYARDDRYIFRLNVPYTAALEPGPAEAARKAGIRLTACLPVITKPDCSGRPVISAESAEALRRLCYEGNLYGVSVASPSQLMYFTDESEKKEAAVNVPEENRCRQRVRIFFEESMNLYNVYTAAAAHACGMSCGVLSHELLPEELKAFSAAADFCEVSVWGRIPLMHTEHCPVGSAPPAARPPAGAGRHGESIFCTGSSKKHYCRSASYALRDRKGCIFPLVPDDSTCRCTVMSHRTADMTDRTSELKKAGIRRFRINIFDESSDTIMDIIGKIS